MFDKHQEHLDSQPDNSRWDGFDRGDAGRADAEYDQGVRVIGRMSSSRGKVVVLEMWDGYWTGYEVTVGGVRVHNTGDRNQALTVGRWWVKGCPA